MSRSSRAKPDSANRRLKRAPALKDRERSCNSAYRARMSAKWRAGWRQRDPPDREMKHLRPTARHSPQSSRGKSLAGRFGMRAKERREGLCEGPMLARVVCRSKERSASAPTGSVSGASAATGDAGAPKPAAATSAPAPSSPPIGLRQSTRRNARGPVSPRSKDRSRRPRSSGPIAPGASFFECTHLRSGTSLSLMLRSVRKDASRSIRRRCGLALRDAAAPLLRVRVNVVPAISPAATAAIRQSERRGSWRCRGAGCPSPR